MERDQNTAIVLELIARLRGKGSWCGATHIQKAVYCLQELANVPVGHDFVLYKHGPYSFDLNDELLWMRADDLIEQQANPFPYGPSLIRTETGKRFCTRFERTIGRYSEAIDLVSEKLAPKGVVDLERLATALFVTRENGNRDVQDRARQLHRYKPHVPVEAAAEAVAEVDRLISIAQSTPRE